MTADRHGARPPRQRTFKTLESASAGSAGAEGASCEETGDFVAGEVSDDCHGIEAMTLEDFATADLVLEVDCKAIQETVVFASDNAVVPDRISEMVVYRARELRHLATIRPRRRQLETVHQAKKVFGGLISGATLAATDDSADGVD